VHPADPGAHVARILNAAYMVRHHRRALARELRRAAIAEMGIAVRLALDASRDDEALLYAVAIGLHDPHDPRFQV
jgi:hypothetical protein